MRKTITPVLILALAIFAPPLAAADYVIDTKGAHASINFRIQHLGYSWLVGRFNEFHGSFSYDENNPGSSKIEVTIDPASIDSNHAERDKHLRSEDFLDVKKFPSARFVSSSYKEMGNNKATLTGNLTLHGVTRPITIDVEKIGGGPDPWGGNRLGFYGTTRLSLSEFGINYNLGPASREVELTLSIEGIRQ
jgi:polyisoprenoid-binding protein YceI